MTLTRPTIAHAQIQLPEISTQMFIGGRWSDARSVEPTVFFDVNPQSVIAREEIFGPVGAVMPFDTIDQAIRLANDTRYGLAAAIWTQDPKAAHTVASKVRAGVVWVNGWAAIDPALPWGGMKTSGIGRELGLSGLLADTEEKVVTIIL